jgi:hypothetical protein
MKHIFSVFLISFLLITACKAPAPDMNESEKFAEQLINELKANNWDAALEFYDPSENKEDRASKLMQIDEAMGGINSFELTESLSNTDPGQASYVLLTYKIMRSKINSKESFKIISDEGKLMVVQHNIETSK